MIFSDSLSVIQSLNNLHNKNPNVQLIQDKIYTSNKNFKLIWIPSHIGIVQNEIADSEAKAAIHEPLDENYKINMNDCKQIINEKINDKWTNEWLLEHNNKLQQIKKDTNKWKYNNLSRKETIKLTRLRIGHTKLTHEPILKKQNPPICECGNIVTVTT